MAFRADLYLVAQASGRNVTVEPNAHIVCETMVIGATLPMSVASGSIVKAFTLTVPSETKDGIVAVLQRRYATYGKGVYERCMDEMEYAFLHVSVDGEGNAHINLERPWIPSGPIIGQIIAERIDVFDTENDEHYTSSARVAKHHGWVFVEDVGLLLRYLHGSATREEVLAASQKFLGEQDEIAKLRADLEAVRAERDALEGDLNRARVALTDTKKDRARLTEFEVLTRVLLAALERQLYTRPSVAKAAQDLRNCDVCGS